MAQIKQVGIGRKSTGTIDGITYYTRNGKTFARSTPTMPSSAYNTPEAKVRQTIFKFIQMHMKYHLRTIRQTITNKSGSPSNRYYNINKKGLTKALQTLAEQYIDGEDVTIDDIEAAISAYAVEHPKSITIASKSGYNEVFLTGPWPDTIRMSANEGDSTVIIIVNEYGQQTTINADGTTVVSGSNEGSNENGGTGGSNENENQNENPSGGNENSGTSGTGGSNENQNENSGGGGSNENQNQNENPSGGGDNGGDGTDES